MGDLRDHLRAAQVLEVMVPELDEPDRGRQGVAHQISRHLRAQHLARVRRAHQTGGAVQHRPEIVAVALLGDPGVEAHPDSQRTRLPPRLSLQGALARDRGVDGIVGGWKHGRHAVTGALHDVAAVRFDRFAQKGIMACQCLAHRLGVLLPEARGTLQVGEQERDRAGRAARSPHPLLVPGSQ